MSHNRNRNGGLFVVDFHTHVLGPDDVKNICPEMQNSKLFKKVTPIFEPICHVTEPVHDQFLRHLAMNYNNVLCRYGFALASQVFLMEALRLFKRHGLARLIESMHKQGIDHATIYSLEPVTKTQEIIDLVKPYGDKFSVFGSVGKDVDDPASYLEPMIKSGSLKGIKIHPIIGNYACGELHHATKDFVALASDYELPVAIHTGHIPIEGLPELSGCTEIGAVEPLIRAFPKCQFVLNHIGWESWRAALKIANRYPNVMVETSWQPAKVMRRAVDSLGAHRVLFGSDYPMFQQWQALREIKRALSPKEFEMVASTNALRLLRMAPKKVASSLA